MSLAQAPKKKSKKGNRPLDQSYISQKENVRDISKELAKVWLASDEEPRVVADAHVKPCEALVLYDDILWNGVTYHIHYHVYIDASKEIPIVSIPNGGGHVINTNIGSNPRDMGTYKVYSKSSKIGGPDPSVTAELDVIDHAKAYFASFDMNEEPRKSLIARCEADKLRKAQTPVIVSTGGKKKKGRRRNKGKSEAPENKKSILEEYEEQHGELEIDNKRRIVDMKGKPVRVKKQDYKELLHAISSRNSALSETDNAKQEIYDIYAYGYGYDGDYVYDAMNVHQSGYKYLYGNDYGNYQREVDTEHGLIGFNDNGYGYGEFGIFAVAILIFFMALIPICYGICCIVVCIWNMLWMNKQIEPRDEYNDCV